MIVLCVATAARLIQDGVETELPAGPHLALGAPYKAEPAGDGWLRVWDDRGEDSLYPASLFQVIRD